MDFRLTYTFLNSLSLEEMLATTPHFQAGAVLDTMEELPVTC